ncbi:PrgI family protein [Candidatus Daviesbacteria bacterium]|nr:PrgI family protein [Candidatus Daviesbacteria bacterium]
MDAHPIPQNVTSFQFKLIGDMTLKQFAYLAVGSATAYFLFVFLAHDYPLIAWPLIAISALLGIAFAFLPIGSRPLDHWTKAFLKAVYSPTKRVWGKNGKTFKEDPLFGSRLVMYLAGATQINQQNQSTSGSERQIKPDKPAVLFSETPILRHSDTPAPLPTPEELGKTVDLARQAQQLQMKIIQTERTLSQIKTQAQNPTPIPVDYSQQVNKVLTDLQNLVGQASKVKQQIQTVQEPQPKTPVETSQAVAREKVKVVVANKPQKATLALTTFPNVINGIVKDKQGNYLEGVVTVIYDKEGLPVRALKTNKLGQFTGSTPLLNGTYTLELEKDGFTFDVLQIELTGQVLSPLAITAK